MSDAPGKAFERGARVRRRSEFAMLRNQGHSLAGKMCVVRWLLPPPDGVRRVSIVTSRRFSPRAVVRNRARRLLREAYRQIYRDMPPAWVLLIPRRAIQSARLPDVLSDLERVCRGAGLLASAADSGPS